MPRNYFADPYSAGQEAFDGAYDRTQGFFDKMNSRQAGAALGGGDRAGAAGILARSGNLQGARAIEGDQIAAEDRQYQRGRDAIQDKRVADEDARKLAAQRAEVLKQVTGAARRINGSTPDGLAKRKQFILQALPVLGQQHGFDMNPLVQQVTGLQDVQFDDNNLMAFDGELDNHVKLFNTRSGVVAVDQDALNRDINDPKASRTVYEDKYADQMAEATIEQKRAAAAKARRPPAPRGNNGHGKGAAAGPRPTGRHY